MLDKKQEDLKRIIKKRFPSLTRRYTQWIMDSTPVHIVSFPKCGRTWLRVMLVHLLKKSYDIDMQGHIDILKLTRRIPDLDNIIFSHDFDVHLKHVDEIAEDKEYYKSKKVILLVRDVRDVVVSSYFQYMKRGTKYQAQDPDYNGSLSEFLRYDIASTQSVVKFYNSWAKNKEIPEKLLVVTYEDMHANPNQVLRSIGDFLSIKNLTDKTIDDAIDVGSFKRMRDAEEKQLSSDKSFNAGDINDNESFKARKGKVGGYTEYLTDSDIKYIEGEMEKLVIDYKWGDQEFDYSDSNASISMGEIC